LRGKTHPPCESSESLPKRTTPSADPLKRAATFEEDWRVLLAVGTQSLGDLFKDINWTTCVLSVADLAILVSVGIYLTEKFRANPLQKEPVTSEMLTKFRQMHERGVLSEEEFRTIKTSLTEQLQQELNDNGETG